MGTDRADSLGRLVHDVNGKCAHLKSAVALLRGEDSREELELLGLMVQQARSLAEALSAYESVRKSGPRK
jgi:hypothetical protein